jgi:hypothetical protein
LLTPCILLVASAASREFITDIMFIRRLHTFLQKPRDFLPDPLLQLRATSWTKGVEKPPTVHQLYREYFGSKTMRDVVMHEIGRTPGNMAFMINIQLRNTARAKQRRASVTGASKWKHLQIQSETFHTAGTSLAQVAKQTTQNIDCALDHKLFQPTKTLTGNKMKKQLISAYRSPEAAHVSARIDALLPPPRVLPRSLRSTDAIVLTPLLTSLAAFLGPVGCSSCSQSSISAKQRAVYNNRANDRRCEGGEG